MSIMSVPDSKVHYGQCKKQLAQYGFVTYTWLCAARTLAFTGQMKRKILVKLALIITVPQEVFS